MKRWILIIVLLIGLAILGISWNSTRAELSNTKFILSNTKATLERTETELSTTKVSLQKTETELKASRADVEHWKSIANPKQFSSLQELKNWLASDDTNTHKYSKDFDCDDFALMLQQHAKDDGYKIDIQTVYFDDWGYDAYGDLWFYYNYHYYWPGLPGLKFKCYHAMNTAIIGNSIYLIEPYTDEVLFWCLVD